MDSYSNQTSVSIYDYIFVDLAGEILYFFYVNVCNVKILDPRTNDWFLIKDPLPPLTILILYLYFVRSWGPRFMENRKPFEFKYTLIIYNFLQVLVSIFLVYEVSNAI